jgi:hypothetical protein
MNPSLVHRLPAALEPAVQRIKLAARDAVERTIESLGLASLASRDVFQRDGLLGAQFELNRKSAVFALAFNDAFDERLQRERAPRDAAARTTSWDALSLVEDRELEIQVAAERFGLEIAHGCEWELRELDGYVASLLGGGRPEGERNPLRPEVIGYALIRAVESVSERPEIRKVLQGETARSMGALLRGVYGDIVADLRGAGVQPLGLSVRTVEARGPAGAAAAPDETGPGGRGSAQGALESHYGVRGAPSRGFSPSTRAGIGSTRGTPLGRVDPGLMNLIRRLAYAEGPVGGAVATGGSDWGADGGIPVNLIRAHRDELRQASEGSLDHMVIDVIGSLFDQILADPKLPPQLARHIARLQLPVLRAALGDPSFFSSRRHPVRRFVNRIASLGAAFEDFSEADAQQFLARVRQLVQEVVEGDFDQIELYEQKLAALEQFVDAQGRAAVDPPAAALLAAKEDELRLAGVYAQQLESDLGGLSVPAFVREFIAGVWSQVLLAAAGRDPDGSGRLKRLRQVARDLFMSVQPKTSPAARKTFLAELPKLMQGLNEGMDLIGWPDAERRNFFGALLPAHAESLKAQPLSPLDFNMLARQVEGALDKPLPTPEQLRAAPVAPPPAEAAPRFTPEEIAEAAAELRGRIAALEAENRELREAVSRAQRSA